MQGLTFRTDQDFEEICCYLMRDWVARNMRYDVQFRRYGTLLHKSLLFQR